MKGFLFIYLFIKLLIKIKDMIPKNQFLRRGFLFNFFFNVDKIATSKRKENVHNFGYKQGMVFLYKKSKDPSMLLAT